MGVLSKVFDCGIPLPGFLGGGLTPVPGVDGPTHPPPPPPPPPEEDRFTCVAGVCVKHDTGEYASLEDCQANCVSPPPPPFTEGGPGVPGIPFFRPVLPPPGPRYPGADPGGPGTLHHGSPALHCRCRITGPPIETLIGQDIMGADCDAICNKVDSRCVRMEARWVQTCMEVTISEDGVQDPPHDDSIHDYMDQYLDLPGSTISGDWENVDCQDAQSQCTKKCDDIVITWLECETTESVQPDAGLFGGSREVLGGDDGGGWKFLFLRTFL